ncbi:hypothetical protein [Planctopirus hydrillae]|nr:hypothetical protein [Planctopirus hydrillae]
MQNPDANAAAVQTHKSRPMGSAGPTSRVLASRPTIAAGMTAKVAIFRAA